MSEFNPSNGYVRYSKENIFLNLPGWNEYWLCPDHVKALRAFFLKERDQELGRWRDPEHQNIVVYPNFADSLGNRGVRVLGEVSGTVERIYENDIPKTFYGGTARTYFAAHPDSKPWHDAKPGEVWAVDFEAGVREAIIVPNSGWNKSLATVSARRIWPEGSNDS